MSLGSNPLDAEGLRHSFEPDEEQSITLFLGEVVF